MHNNPFCSLQDISIAKRMYEKKKKKKKKISILKPATGVCVKIKPKIILKDAQ